MGLNCIVCLLSTVCSDVSRLTVKFNRQSLRCDRPWGRDSVSPADGFLSLQNCDSVTRPVCLWLQANLVVHMGNLLMSVGVFGPGPVKISISLNASRAAWDRGQPWNCKQPPQPAWAEPGIQTWFYKADALKYRKMMCFNWWKHISSAWDTFFCFISPHCALVCAFIGLFDRSHNRHNLYPSFVRWRRFFTFSLKRWLECQSVSSQWMERRSGTLKVQGSFYCHSECWTEARSVKFPISFMVRLCWTLSWSQQTASWCSCSYSPGVWKLSEEQWMGILCGSTGVESILVRVQAGKDVISRLSVSQSTSSVWDRATGRWSLRQGIADFTGTGRMMAVFRQKWSVPVEANITGICMMHRKFSFLDSLICKDAMELVDRHFSVVSAVKTQG